MTPQSFWLSIPASGVILKPSHRPYPVLPLTWMTPPHHHHPVRWTSRCSIFPAVIDANGASPPHRQSELNMQARHRWRRMKASWVDELTPDAFFLTAKWQRNATETGVVPSSRRNRVLWKRAPAAFNIPWRPLCGLGLCGRSPARISGTQS